MEQIRIRGARTHNLKNVNLDLPRHKLIVITGLDDEALVAVALDEAGPGDHVLYGVAAGATAIDAAARATLAAINRKTTR